MAFDTDGVVTYKDASDVSKNIRTRTGSGEANIEGAVLYDKDGAAIDATHPLSVKIEADAAGSSTAADDEDIPRNDASTALASAILYAATGTDPSGASRKILYGYSGALGVTERACEGTSTITWVTVDATTNNGVALVAANTTKTRRRVVVTNHTTKVVWIYNGNLTEGAPAEGEPLAGVIGAEKTFFMADALRATVATADTSAVVSVREEVLA